MSDDTGKGALVNVGDLSGLSEPAVKLVDRVADALGGVFRPWQIRRVAAAEADATVLKARADADAAKVTALAKIELETELEERALRRVLAQESKRQANIESIVAEAVRHVARDASPGAIDDDWMELFLDRSKLVGNQEMQQVWARLLAGEANKPGQFSRRTVEIVASMSKSDAELFVALCSLVDRNFLDGTPFVYEPDSPDMYARGLGSHNLAHLESFGLIRLLDVNHWEWRTTVPGAVPVNTRLTVFGKTLQLVNPGGNEFVITLGRVSLTPSGRELLAITEAPPPATDIVETIATRIRTRGYTVTIE
ncbi:DUF2806 domain-containing protein [Burkholderia ubonensis]|uniref:DUF2806 domain-containing protein n=1 Tax=Burkholderia ubonensis TaxID=101571 RepID=UPI0005D92568|nr:DUF2806 domain-containing protein [Burkholderia ubonensis]AJX17011.1 hypothetical protein BW23_2886 [Burkholderia ubonensis MSMB22]KVP17890.1 hypothetical protein WJ84_13960 [Burkholderia ubonensis]KVP70498.1 hypothetical protein WJ94_29340 [Burkholderia ubonensis]KVR55282.1 hypothetical protein WK19_14170 [Burkholderia ubonensis]KVR63335.1 hypothetical protein WK20_00040 [Burkholderia ubonensis]